MGGAGLDPGNANSGHTRSRRKQQRGPQDRTDRCRFKAIPAARFFSRSCFSRSVALAGKMAGKARKSPPMTGPNLSPSQPVTTIGGRRRGPSPAKGEKIDAHGRTLLPALADA